MLQFMGCKELNTTERLNSIELNIKIVGNSVQFNSVAKE